jgi:hypothetical protein
MVSAARYAKDLICDEVTLAATDVKELVYRQTLAIENLYARLTRDLEATEDLEDPKCDVFCNLGAHEFASIRGNGRPIRRVCV